MQRKRLDRLNEFPLELIIFSGFSLLYFLTASKSNYWGDSGEFLAASKILGIPHPPGHPLYPLVVKSCFTIFSRIFTLEMSAAMISVFSSATALAFLYKLLCQIPVNNEGGLKNQITFPKKISALTVTLALGFGRTIWFYATIAEVYSLMFLFLALILNFSLNWWKFNKGRLYLIIAYLIALSSGNNILILCFLPIFFLIFLYIYFKEKNNAQSAINIGTTLQMFFCILIGFSIYLYLPIRAFHSPELNWGDADNFKRFFHNVFLQDFERELFEFSYIAADSFKAGIIEFIRIFKENLTLPGVFFVLPGMLMLLKGNKLPFLLVSGFIFAFDMVLSILYGGGMVLDAYLIPALVSGSLWVHSLIQGAFEFKRISGIIAVSVVLCFSLINLREWKSRDLGNRDEVLQYGTILFENLPYGSIFATDNSNDYFCSMHSKIVLEQRKDIKLIYSPLLNQDWYRNQLELELGIDLQGSNPRACMNSIFKNPDVSGKFFYTPRKNIELDPGIFKVWGPFLIPHGAWLLNKNDSFLYGENILEKINSCLLQTGDTFSIQRLNTIYYYLSKAFILTGEPDSGAVILRTAAEKVSLMTMRTARGGVWSAKQVAELNATLWYNTGILYGEANDLNKALTATKRAVEFKPEIIQYRLHLARLFLKHNDIADSKNEFQRIIESGDEKNSSEAHAGLALCYMETEEWNSAINENLKAIENEPDNPEILNNLGFSYLRAGSIPEASRYFKRAILAGPWFEGSYYNLARLYMVAGDRIKALKIIDEGLKNVPRGNLLMGLNSEIGNINSEDEKVRSMWNGGESADE